MGSPSRPAPPDYDRIVERLTALASPVRLEILGLLRMPRLLSEIRVRPARVNEGESGDRSIARTSLLAHVHKLVDAGLVRERETVHNGSRAMSYQAEAQRVYELLEDLRRVPVVNGAPLTDVEATAEAHEARLAPTNVKGPRLVIVHGLYDARAYALTDGAASPEGWIVGRERGLAVSLDYDPFVSLRNALVSRSLGRWLVKDLSGSRNGTWVNWARLEPGASRRIEHGDVIGVGRSLLLFRTD